MLARHGMKPASDDLEQNAADTGRYVAKPNVDLSHHLSELARSRNGSPLKGLFKYLAVPGIIMMAGGLPHPDYFPFDSLSAEALTPDVYPLDDDDSSSTDSTGMFGWLWGLFGSSVPTKTLSVPKYDKDPTELQLSTALQYSDAKGQVALQTFIREFVRSVFQPLNAATDILVHDGNTDGWTKIIATVCEPGELILTEEWAYTSALAAARPYQIKPVGVPMDGQGMRADALEEILANWDVEARGAARPHVMYTVPVGQNPCGTTMGAERKKAIYDICVRYDVLIVEDDPYYFLQVGEYQNPSQRISTKQDGEKEFLDSLVPSYLRFDYQGRVIRLDTFSKTIAPGSRLGWYTASPLFLERIERAVEISAQAPSGFSQSLITQLLTKQWKYSGWIRWLRGTRARYTARRDMMVDTLASAFEIEEEYEGITPGSDSVRSFVGRSKRHSLKEKKGKVLFSFVAPTAGMFIWLKIHLYNHPAYVPGAPPPKTAEETLEFQLWDYLAMSGLLLAPGWWFGTSAESRLETHGMNAGGFPLDGKYHATSEGGRFGHLRLSYSNPSAEDLNAGFARFAKALDQQFYTS